MTFPKRLLRVKALLLLVLWLSITQMVWGQRPAQGGALIKPKLTDESETEKYLKIFRAIAGEKGTCFTRPRLKQFLRENSFRNLAHNKDSFLYASDFSSMKKEFESGIFGDVIKYPVGIIEHPVSNYRYAIFWGLQYESRILPFVAADETSEPDLARFDLLLEEKGRDVSFGRKISSDTVADILFDVMVEKKEDKTKVGALDFVIAGYRLTNQLFL